MVNIEIKHIVCAPRNHVDADANGPWMNQPVLPATAPSDTRHRTRAGTLSVACYRQTGRRQRLKTSRNLRVSRFIRYLFSRSLPAAASVAASTDLNCSINENFFFFFLRRPRCNAKLWFIREFILTGDLTKHVTIRVRRTYKEIRHVSRPTTVAARCTTLTWPPTGCCE